MSAHPLRDTIQVKTNWLYTEMMQKDKDDRHKYAQTEKKCISIYWWDRKESKFDGFCSNQRAHTHLKIVNKKWPSTSLEMARETQREKVSLNQCISTWSLEIRTLSNWNAHFSSIPIDTRYLTWIIFTIFNELKNVPFFFSLIMSCHLCEAKHSQKKTPTTKLNIKCLEECWFESVQGSILNSF